MFTSFYKKAVRAAYRYYSGLFFFIYSFLRRASAPDKSNGKNVIIVGGELFNKGAQAMTFTAVGEIRKRYPGKDIYLFSSVDHSNLRDRRDIYNFRIIRWDWKDRLTALGMPGKADQRKDAISRILEEASCFIDISGYGLSSQWGWFKSLAYLSNIAVAKKYGAKYFILPQSIGPFKYPLLQKIFIYPLLRKYLQLPERVYVRETDGMRWCGRFRKGGLELFPDIVLQSDPACIPFVFREKTDVRKIPINGSVIGVIPNARVAERMREEDFLRMYKMIISWLLNRGCKVCILRHSREDLRLCVELKDMFRKDKRVAAITDDFDPFEIEDIIKQFKFIIASRYHSIVHAYKSNVPVVAIGWAEKYRELLSHFGQEAFFFDCRNGIDVNAILSKISFMFVYTDSQKKRIADSMKDMKKVNVFDQWSL